MSAKNASEFLGELKSLVAELRKYQAEVNSVKRSVSVTSALKTKKEETLKALDSRFSAEDKSLNETLSNVYSTMLKFGRDNYSSYEKFSERLNDIRDNFSNIAGSSKVTKSQQMSFDGLVKTIEGALDTIVYDVQSSEIWSQISSDYHDSQEEIEFNQSMYVRHYETLKELLSVKLQTVAEYNKAMESDKAYAAKLEKTLEALEEEKADAQKDLASLNLESLKKEFVSIPLDIQGLKEDYANIKSAMNVCDEEIQRLTALLGDESDEITDEELQASILVNQEKLDELRLKSRDNKEKSMELNQRLVFVQNAIKNFRVLLVEAQQKVKSIDAQIAITKSDLQVVIDRIKLNDSNHTTYMVDLEGDVRELFNKIIKLTDRLEDATRGVLSSNVADDRNLLDASKSKIKSHPYGEAWFKFKSMQLQYVVLTDSFEIADAVKLFDSTNKAIQTLQSLVDAYNKSNEILANNKSESCDNLYPMIETLGGYTETMSRIQDRLDEINDFTSGYETNLANLEADLISNNEWIANLQSEKAEYEESVSVAQAAIANLDTESETYADDLANLEAEIASLNDSISGVDVKISEAEEKSMRIQDEKANLISENESMISEKETLDADYSNVKAENENQLSSLMDSIYGVSERLAKANSELGYAEAGIKKTELLISEFNDYMSRNPWEMWFMYDEKSSEEEDNSTH